MRILKTHKKQLGLSLIELMVSMSLGLFITAGALKVYASNKDTYMMQETMTELQRNSRYIRQRIGTKLMNSGFSGFNEGFSTNLNSFLDNANDFKWNLLDSSL